MIIFSLILVTILLTLSAYFAAAETAITASSPGKIQKAKIAGDPRAKKALKLIKIKDTVISSLLIMNSGINTIATTIATTALISIFGGEGVVIASAVMSVIIIVFVEFIPKAIAVVKAEDFVIKSTYFLIFVLKILKPINAGLKLSLRLFCSIFRVNLTQDISGDDEVRGIIEHHASEGNVFKDDKDMLGGVLDLKSISVSDIMTHRSNMVSLDVDMPLKDLTAQVLNSNHSRIPLWKNDKENVVGILHIKDLVKSLYDNNFNYTQLNIMNFTTEPWFIPDQAFISDQLHFFKEKKSHIALVIDEYGDLQGILTLEDILEEIVGQIEDEHDVDSKHIIQKSDHSFVIDGSASIRDINRELGWNLPDEDANTLAGLVIHEAQKIPEQGEVFEAYNLKIVVQRKKNNKIKTLFVEQSAPKEE